MRFCGVWSQSVGLDCGDVQVELIELARTHLERLTSRLENGALSRDRVRWPSQASF